MCIWETQGVAIRGWEGEGNKRRDLLSRGACNPILKAHRVNTPALSGRGWKERLINSIQYTGVRRLDGTHPPAFSTIRIVRVVYVCSYECVANSVVVAFGQSVNVLDPVVDVSNYS